MDEITIRKIGAENLADAQLKNETFSVWGRMVPALRNGIWSYTAETFAAAEEMTFPDENYDVSANDGIFMGAYRGEQCIGLAVLRKAMFRYLYLDDLKVCADFRRQGVGAKLIGAAMKEAEDLGLQGVYTIAQDNNLSACLFYLKCGFAIGGFDNRAYRGTPQENKADIYFYKDI